MAKPCSVCWKCAACTGLDMEVGFSALNTSVRGPFSVKCFLRSLTSCHKVCAFTCSVGMWFCQCRAYTRRDILAVRPVALLATGWTVRGSNPVGCEIFRTCPDRPWGPPSFLYNAHRVFPGGKERPGRDADSSPPSSIVVKKESYTSTPPMGRTACTEPQCLYRGALYILPLPLALIQSTKSKAAGSV